MCHLYRLITLFCSLLILCYLAVTPALGQTGPAGERILLKAKNQPLVSLKDAAERAKARTVVSKTAREVLNFSWKGKPDSGGGMAVADAIVQQSVGEQITAVVSGFDGASNEDNANLLGFRISPPDTDGQVGPAHYVQMINLLTTVFDKNGTVLLGPSPSNIFWDGIGGNCQEYNQGDPIVLYDEVADRWLISQFAFPDSLGSFSQCVAISQTNSPLGGWHRYEFSFDDYGMNDYPKHGIASDSITMMANLFTRRGRNFNWGGTFLGVMDKTAMYAGDDTARLIGFNIGTAQFGFIAGDLDGTGSVPALFATAMASENALDIWQVDVDWSMSPAPASVSQIASVSISPFDAELCTASRGACIPQPDNGPLLESLSDRLMHRLQIRDFGNYLTMVTAHTVDVGDGRAGIRWYELRDYKDLDGWQLHQQGTFGPADGQYRWMPSAAVNSAGDIGIGYLIASTERYVSIAAIGQTALNYEPGILNSEERICAHGSGVQEDVARSGDYSSTSVDPNDDSFWHTNEVFHESGPYKWDTFVCEFVVADNGGGTNIPPTADFTYTCNERTCSFTDNSTDPDGPIASWDWNFGGDGTSTAQNPVHSFTADGDYMVTLMVSDEAGAGDSIARLVSVSETVNSPPTASFTYSCTDLDCEFDGSSSWDNEGTITSYDWTFGDGGSSSGLIASHSYSAGDSYEVILTVTDDQGATGSETQYVSVSAGGEPTLVGSAETTSRTRWKAIVEDTSGGDLLGTWSASGTPLCVDSVCTLSNIHKNVISVTFTAEGSGVQITVFKP